MKSWCSRHCSEVYICWDGLQHYSATWKDIFVALLSRSAVRRFYRGVSCSTAHVEIALRRNEHGLCMMVLADLGTLPEYITHALWVARGSLQTSDLAPIVAAPSP